MIGFAVIAAAILAYFSLAPAKPNLANFEQFTRAEQRHHTESHDCDSQNGARLTSSRKNIVRADNCAHDREIDRKEQDSRWQAIRTAQATEQAAIEAQRQAVAAAASVSVLIVALAASAIAAWAALETLIHARESAEKELRAYVFVDSTKVKEGGESHLNPVWVKIGYRNSGKTPAKQVKISVRAILIYGGTVINLDDLPSFRSIGPLGPQERRTRDVEIEISPEATRRQSEGRNEIHVFGKITYADVFEPDRWTTFHAYIGGDAKRGKTMLTADTGNDYE